MDLPLARAAAPLLVVVDAVGSTNAALVARERAAPQPHGTAIATLEQTAGRGRLDRSWAAPAGASLAVSVLLRTGLPMASLAWLPILGGLAARAAVAAELPAAAVTVKWPNDVLVGERKIVGVLAELVPETGAVVLGIGVNTAMTAQQLPVPTATSIAVEAGWGDDAPDPVALADRVLATLVRELFDRVDRLAAAGDPVAAGLAAEAAQRCGTIGRAVRVALPDGSTVRGTAIGIDPSGAIVVADHDGTELVVHAGDVTHLRYE